MYLYKCFRPGSGGSREGGCRFVSFLSCASRCWPLPLTYVETTATAAARGGITKHRPNHNPCPSLRGNCSRGAVILRSGERYTAHACASDWHVWSVWTLRILESNRKFELFFVCVHGSVALSIRGWCIPDWGVMLLAFKAICRFSMPLCSPSMSGRYQRLFIHSNFYLNNIWWIYLDCGFGHLYVAHRFACASRTAFHF